MKLFGTCLINRKYLLPLLLTVSVLFISQGIYVPNFSSLQEARLSKRQEAKPRSLVVVKDQIKSSQSRVLKTTPFSDLCSKVDVVDRPISSFPAFNHESPAADSILASTVPARAPPA
jgi:hypothetical protein